MNFRFLIFVLLLVTFINANGNIKVNPQNVENIELVISRSGTITAETGKFSNMDLILSIPQETYYQIVDVQGIEDGQIIKVGESNVLNFKRSEVISSFTYSYNSNVNTNKRVVDVLLNYTNNEKKDFLEETEHIKINNEIKTTAEEIIKNGNSDLEKVALLAIWVNDVMLYDINEVGQNSNSIEVYENRKGVCVEYTNLFLAMVRSIGVPGRAVTGYVYSPDYGWQLHSWAEVYLDKWVGVDPTWLEVASIDATHIPLYFNHDTVLRESVSATLHSQNPLKWMGKGTLGSSTGGIEIKLVTEKVPEYEIKKLPGDVLNVGVDGTLLFEINVDHYMIFQADVNPCKFDTEIVEVEKQKITYFLSPGKNYVPINFKVSDMINPDNKYFCPVTISHTLGYDVVDLNINGRKKSSSFDVYISKINESYVSFKIYSNDGVPINFITNKNQSETEIYMNSISDEIIIKKEGINKKNFIIFNEKKVQYYDLDNLNLGSREIIPVKINFNDKVPNDVVSYLEIDFEFQNEDEMNIMYYINGILISTEKTIERNYTFKRELDKTRMGTQNIMVKVKSYSEEFVYEGSYEVYEPVINYEIIYLGDEEYGISLRGPIKNYKIYINGKEIESNRTEFEKGVNEIKIVWTDLAGYERTYVSNYNSGDILGIFGVIMGLVGIFIIFFFRENIMSWCKCKLK